jgi:hypothetical protein
MLKMTAWVVTFKRGTRTHLSIWPKKDDPSPGEAGSSCRWAEARNEIRRERLTVYDRPTCKHCLKILRGMEFMLK